MAVGRLNWFLSDSNRSSSWAILRKIDPDSTRSWIEGKLFVALLLESLLHQAESFFPWGFPLDSSPPLPLA